MRSSMALEPSFCRRRIKSAPYSAMVIWCFLAARTRAFCHQHCTDRLLIFAIFNRISDDEVDYLKPKDEQRNEADQNRRRHHRCRHRAGRAVAAAAGFLPGV